MKKLLLILLICFPASLHAQDEGTRLINALDYLNTLTYSVANESTSTNGQVWQALEGGCSVEAWYWAELYYNNTLSDAEALEHQLDVVAGALGNYEAAYGFNPAISLQVFEATEGADMALDGFSDTSDLIYAAWVWHDSNCIG